MFTTHTPRPASRNVPLHVVLAPGDILRLTSAYLPWTVTCRRGTCWLTQEGDTLDYVLGVDMSQHVITRGLTLIQAFSECVLELPCDVVRGSRRSTAA